MSNQEDSFGPDHVHRAIRSLFLPPILPLIHLTRNYNARMTSPEHVAVGLGGFGSGEEKARAENLTLPTHTYACISSCSHHFVVITFLSTVQYAIPELWYLTFLISICRYYDHRFT